MTSIQNQTLCIDLSPLCNTCTVDGSGSMEQNSSHQKTGGNILAIHCLSELTPLDMMDMSFGTADPTGSCVWLGAFLFMEMFAREMNDANHNDMQKYWSKVRHTIFTPNCHAIELGAGTGMSGLSLMLTPTRPSLLIQTDNNDDALELCRMNHDANDVRCDDDVHVKKLEWGKGNAAKLFGSRPKEMGTSQYALHMTKSLPATYDVVFATDVLYDISSLAPLLVTASDLLVKNGYFILSHVPRASIDDDNNESRSEEVDPWKKLESIIIEKASNVDLVLATYPPTDENIRSKIIQQTTNEQRMILVPSLLPLIYGETTPLAKKHPWKKMTEVGAAVFVFHKK